MDIYSHEKLLKALKNSLLLSDDTTHTLQTHISSLLLSGKFAYKIKKPVDFGFVDYTTLEKREHFCHEEIRLNGRFAPSIYLDVVKITGTLQEPKIVSLKQEGIPLEYAVRMVRFDDKLLLDRLCKEGKTPDRFLDIVDTLAKNIADFHKGAKKADEKTLYGTPDVVMDPISENFLHIRKYLKKEGGLLNSVDLIESWSNEQFKILTPIIDERKQKGFVRECHGDMHLGNIVFYEDEPLLFDGIEFNDSFKWIDVISDLAFILMDLDKMGLKEYSNTLLNKYLEITGDYEALRLLRFYQCYRVMVRVKINALRLGQEGLSEDEKSDALKNMSIYIKLALDYIKPSKKFITIMYGLSGSGKSVCAKALAKGSGAVIIRSDVERMRLFGSKDLNQRYSLKSSMDIYGRLEQFTKMIIKADIPVVVDAAFLQKSYRDIFIGLAKELSCEIRIIAVECEENIIRERLKKRKLLKNDISEADERVLDKQILNIEPLSKDEKRITIVVDTGSDIVFNKLLDKYFELNYEII